jgi:hypothetical protein
LFRKMHILALVICFAITATAKVTYTVYSISTIANADPHFSNLATHVQATGYVIAKSKQTDGDYHIMFCDSPGFTSFSRTHCLNAEVVPYLQCNPLPANGTQVTMRGTLRFDGPQDWWEIHPVEWISTTKCMVTGTPPL